MTTGTRPRLPVALALAALLTGCGTAGTPQATGATGASATLASPSTSSTLTGEVRVLAAASLTEPFTTLATAYEAAHPGVTVRLSFGSSTTLAQQIAQGAPADLFASAGEKALGQLPPEARAKPTTTIATNSLEIATPPGNPGRITGLGSLSDPSLDVVLCAETVPCGSAADAVLTKAGINPHVVSRELDVKATLAKVTLGEADAAIVYVSEVKGAGTKVNGVPIPPTQNTTLTYPLVQLTATPAAMGFAGFVSGPDGRAALTAAGFRPPGP